MRAKKLRWFGLDRTKKGNKWKQDIKESGYKFHMNNILSTIGLLNMNGLQKRIAQHIKNGRYYDKYLKNDKIQILKKDNSNSAYWIYSLLVDNKKSLENS